MTESTSEYKKRIEEIKQSIENEPYMAKMREDIAEGISKTGIRQATVEEQFQSVLDETTGKDVISAPELIAARNGELNLKTRLDKEKQEVTAQLAQTIRLDADNLSLNNFNESDRAIILGLSDGEINAVLGQGNVRPDNTSFFKIGKNLLNKGAFVSGNILTNNGLLTPHATLSCSPYLQVTPNIKYTQNKAWTIAFYDSGKVFISALSGIGGGPSTFLVPSDAKFIRTTSANAQLGTVQLELGEVSTPFEDFKIFIPSGFLEKYKILKEDIPPEAISQDHTTFFKRGKNLFNKSTLTVGKSLNTLGELVDAPNSQVSDFIRVDPNTSYSRTFDLNIAWYDINKKFISRIAGEAIPVYTRVSPPNAYYVRCVLTTKAAVADVYQFEKGTQRTAYESHYYHIPTEFQEDQLLSEESMTNSMFRLSASRSNVTSNPHYRKWNPKYRDTFGDLSRWVASSGATRSNDTNSTIEGNDKRENGNYVRTNGKSIRLTKTNTNTLNAEMQVTFTQPLDLSGTHPYIHYYVNEGDGNSSHMSLGVVYVQLIDTNGNLGVHADTGGGPTFRKGWRYRAWRTSSKQTYGDFDITNIVKIKIVIATKAGMEGYTPSVTFDSLDFIPKIKGVLPYVMTADGGYINQKPALAYLASRGIRCHLYVTYDRIGHPGYMTVSDLKEAEQMGHFIDCHEREAAPVGWLSLSQEQKEQSLQESFNWRAKHGFTASNGFCTLGAQWSHEEDDIKILNPYLEHIRVGTADNCVPHNPRVIGLNYDTNFLTVEGELAARNEAIENGTFYVGLVHSLAGSFTLDDFKTIVDSACEDARLKFVTIPELINTNWYEQE